ncbi:MAG TPA: hypothetical protein VHA78_01950 [Candidatus Peribacteraceae bacterium]|nr:hypothetical protein [Candidatus Peribacteraceae bacterium]
MSLSHPFRDGESLEQNHSMLNTSHVTERGYGLSGYEIVERNIRDRVAAMLGDRPFRVASLSHERDGHLVVTVQREMMPLIREILPEAVHLHAFRQEDIDGMHRTLERSEMLAAQACAEITADFPEAIFTVVIENHVPIVRVQGEYKNAVERKIEYARVEYLTHEEYLELQSKRTGMPAANGQSQEHSEAHALPQPHAA